MGKCKQHRELIVANFNFFFCLFALGDVAQNAAYKSLVGMNWEC